MQKRDLFIDALVNINGKNCSLNSEQFIDILTDKTNINVVKGILISDDLSYEIEQKTGVYLISPYSLGKWQSMHVFMFDSYKTIQLTYIHEIQNFLKLYKKDFEITLGSVKDCKVEK